MKDNKKGQKAELLTKSVGTDVVFNYGLRGIGIVLGLFYTSLVLTYLGHSLYGMWITISSIAAWSGYGDLGIGNGLRNQLAVAVAENDELKQKRLIVTAGYTLSKLAGIMFALLTIISEIMFSIGILEASLRIPMHITNAFFCVDLFLGVARSSAYGFQLSWLTSLAQTGTILLRIVAIGLLVWAESVPGLVQFSVVNGICGILGNVIIIFILLNKIEWKKKTELRQYKYPEYEKSISALGIRFFILQLACLILYSTDNVIINKFLSSEAVTEYSLITKVYTTGENLYSIVLISLWSAVTYAMTQGNYAWIKKSIRKLLLVWVVFSVGVVVVSVALNYIMHLWLGENTVYYDTPLILLFALYTITSAFGSIFVNVTNGLGRLKVQTYFAIAEAIVNIPLSIFFATTCGMGIFGVKLATWICCVGSIVFVPIDVIRYLKTKD